MGVDGLVPTGVVVGTESAELLAVVGAEVEQPLTPYKKTPSEAAKKMRRIGHLKWINDCEKSALLRHYFDQAFELGEGTSS